ncbi:MAG: AI-2E family transporter [Clostridia bacterium]|nr:AI-2E family transporter [Clostridia bacterium]MCI2000969.1 AI-2E family transporter [Clostridia bacterium]MCI2015753.1 AI-2E family transporter [Clostridia bacterium]
MKQKKFAKLMNMGTILLMFVICILIYFAISRYSSLCNYIGEFVRIIKPFIYGIAFAYVLSPMCQFYSLKIYKHMFINFKDKEKAAKLSDRLGIILAYISVIFIFLLFVSFVIPHIITSIERMIENFPVWVIKIDMYIKKLLTIDPRMTKQVVNTALDVYEKGINFVKTSIVDNAQQIITVLSGSVWEVVVFFKNVAIGFIVSAYILCNRFKFKAQFKKIVYAVLRNDIADVVLKELKFVNKSFGGFIDAKLLDSFIIGVMAYIILMIMRMPYPVLLSLIIGVTNIIPFFGPFIGAVPCLIIILLTNPLKGLYFIIFIILLQQFDGNILGPKLLGGKVGLSGLWVLFAILVFGSYFGIAGMIVGVPIFAVIYDLISRGINYLLRKKGMSTNTEDYK